MTAYRCAADVAPIRAEPREDAEQVTQALRDEPLAADERRGEWLRVRTSYDYPGWIRETDVVEGAGTLPAARAGRPLEEARAYLGAPYLWGGMTGRGIDCSGLVHMSYRRLGRLVPRDAHQQEDAASKISEAELRPGDLVSYGDGDKECATHIAFWLGNGRILHATEREGVSGVIDEPEPPELVEKRRFLLRL